MLAIKFAVFFVFNPVRMLAFVFVGSIVAPFAFLTDQIY
jgi:hypothetical protein